MVYEPQEDSYLLAGVVQKVVQPGMNVLDMGTGSGIQAIAACDAGARTVVAVDIDYEALDFTTRAIEKKEIKNIRVKHSDLFSELGAHDVFDVIIFNAPYLPDDERDPDLALDGGKTGSELIMRFLGEVGSHLEEDGKILLVFSTQSGMAEVMQAITANGFIAEEKAKEVLFFEGLYVYLLTRQI